jgi:hypothetical protein
LFEGASSRFGDTASAPRRLEANVTTNARLDANVTFHSCTPTPIVRSLVIRTILSIVPSPSAQRSCQVSIGRLFQFCFAKLPHMAKYARQIDSPTTGGATLDRSAKERRFFQFSLQAKGFVVGSAALEYFANRIACEARLERYGSPREALF